MRDQSGNGAFRPDRCWTDGCNDRERIRCALIPHRQHLSAAAARGEREPLVLAVGAEHDSGNGTAGRPCSGQGMPDRDFRDDGRLPGRIVIGHLTVVQLETADVGARVLVLLFRIE